MVTERGFTFIDLFAGIGGMRLAFERAGGTCVFSSEWNKFSQQTYEANFGEVPEGDITKIDAGTVPDHDILVGGFPCQPFSIAGVSSKKSLGREHGFKDATQGTLFFDICRIIKAKRPKAFLLENVKNLKSHDGGNTFRVILKALREELGYDVHYKVIDASRQVPQHRERIFIVGFDSPTNFEFPELEDKRPRLEYILEKRVGRKYTLTDGTWNSLQRHLEKHREKGNGFGYSLADKKSITKTLSARYYKDGAEILIPQKGRNPRKLTPRECARLMGFPETFKIVVSDNQAYRQFGNAVVVPVVERIADSIVTCLNEGKKRITLFDYAR
ncbi:DNA (cytosine-5-)-methyltransferase [Candidatus Nitrosotenuis cloacae]|uniref:DNA (cytosine-5-)-methyltransferase n=1 Tax=Candidatus Nitrosotenuis cloacae TaxID=1603555 RepID=UPI002282D69F|nr:DNA (cytosine-5-)-methyltransferase [Candidatus Nitrosotenuis cloacae]